MPLLFNSFIQRTPSFITPNQISVMGFLLALISALFIYLAKFNPFHFIWAAVFMFLYALADNFDGILARAKNQVTKCGFFLDYTLDKIAYQILLFSSILGGHIRTELVVISMLLALFYSLLNVESLALTGSTAPLAERPRWLVLAIILCVVAFLLKFLKISAITLSDIKIQSLDAIFIAMPLLIFALIIRINLSLWRELKKLDRREKK